MGRCNTVQLANFIQGLQGGSAGLSGLLVFHSTMDILISPASGSSGEDTAGDTVNTPGNFQDISSIFPPVSVLSLRYEDHISFQADNLEIICPDPNDTIINNKAIRKGTWLKIKLHQWNAEYPGSHTMMDTGSHQIDQIKQVGPPTQTVLMATSVPIGGKIKTTLENKVILTTDLYTLAKNIAERNGLRLRWIASPKGNIMIGQAQQWNETDLMMLSRYLKSRALSMKIRDGTLIVFDEQEAELQPPVYTVDFGSKSFGLGLSRTGSVKGLVHWELTTQSQDIYSLATLDFYDPNSGGNQNTTVLDPNGESQSGTKEELHLYEDPGSPSTKTPGDDIADLGRGD